MICETCETCGNHGTEAPCSTCRFIENNKEVQDNDATFFQGVAEDERHEAMREIHVEIEGVEHAIDNAFFIRELKPLRERLFYLKAELKMFVDW